jgi:hypothetical protein
MPAWRAPALESCAVVNLGSDSVIVTGGDGALMPYDGLVDPIVVTRRIGLGLLATDRRLDEALFALIHHVTDHLGSNQVSVTALSMTCR